MPPNTPPLRTPRTSGASPPTSVAQKPSSSHLERQNANDSPTLPSAAPVHPKRPWLSEVRTGFEPAYNGFANRCLTTWLPHRLFERGGNSTRSGAVVNRFGANRVAGLERRLATALGAPNSNDEFVFRAHFVLFAVSFGKAVVFEQHDGHFLAVGEIGRLVEPDPAVFDSRLENHAPELPRRVV